MVCLPFFSWIYKERCCISFLFLSCSSGFVALDNTAANKQNEALNGTITEQKMSFAAFFFNGFLHMAIRLPLNFGPLEFQKISPGVG